MPPPLNLFQRRVRERKSMGEKGSWRRFGSSISGQQILSTSNWVEDYTDPGDNHPFLMRKTVSLGGELHSSYDPGYWGSYWQMYRCDIFNDPDTNFPHWNSSLHGDKTLGEFAAEAIKRTNPSRPYVDIPVSAFELGEVMDLIRNTGNTLIKKAGRNNLKVQFGLLPLIGDLDKITKLDDQLIRRIRVFEKLKTKRGYRRTVDLGHYSGTAMVVKTMQSVGGTFAHTFRQTCTRQFRGHVRWMPDADFRSLDKAGLVRLAIGTIIGQHTSASTMWEALPWSWLIDWGSSFGNYLAAKRNTIGASPDDVTIMTETHSVYETPYSFAYNPTHLMASKVERWEKKRERATASFSAHMPFLTANQLGILASLSVTRR